MESKEKLEHIKKVFDRYIYAPKTITYFDIVAKDLDRLEKQDKAIEILKPFLKDRICKEESGIEWCGFREEPYYVIDDNDPFPLEKEQYELLKEVFG